MTTEKPLPPFCRHINLAKDRAPEPQDGTDDMPYLIWTVPIITKDGVQKTHLAVCKTEEFAVRLASVNGNTMNAAPPIGQMIDSMRMILRGFDGESNLHTVEQRGH